MKCITNEADVMNKLVQCYVATPKYHLKTYIVLGLDRDTHDGEEARLKTVRAVMQLWLAKALSLAVLLS